MSSRTAKTVDDELPAADVESEVRNHDVLNTEMQSSVTENSRLEHIHEERRRSCTSPLQQKTPKAEKTERSHDY